MRGACVALAIGALHAGAAGQSASIDTPGEKPKEIRGLELTNRLGEQLPLDIRLTDSTGKTVTLGERLSAGRPVVITMIYLRCPLLCPQMQQRVIASFNGIADFTIGTDYDALFVSFDPRDTPVNASKAKENAVIQYDRPATEQIRQGMSYMTGDVKETQRLADALGYGYRYLPESGEFSHGTAVYVVTPKGVLSACFTKLEYDPKDLRLSLVDASDGKIGTILDMFTLWCYHPTDAGDYIIAPMQVMRIGAALSAVFVVSFVGVWAYRDVRRRKRLAGARAAMVTGAGGTVGGPDMKTVALNSASLGHSR